MNALEARVSARQHEFERDLSLAWHTAAMSGAAQAGKLKPLASYLKKAPKVQAPGEMLAVLRQLKEGGAPMTIREVKTGDATP